MDDSIESTKKSLDEGALTSVAARLADQLPSGHVLIFLQGDLGTGKSTFARAFLRAVGVEGRIKSPTYTLIEPYEAADRCFYHLDLYRLADPEELEYLAFRDLLSEDSVLLIEWPEKAHGLLPKPDLQIQLTMKDALHRDATVIASSPLAAPLMKLL